MSYQPFPELPSDHRPRSVRSMQWTLFSVITVMMFGVIAAWTVNGAGVDFWESTRRSKVPVEDFLGATAEFATVVGP